MKFKEFKSILKTDAKLNIIQKPHTIDVSKYINETYPKPKKMGFRTLMVSFSSLLFLVVVTLFGYMNLNTVATVSIDVNPSLTLDINAFNRVTKVSADNVDALTMLDTINLKHKKVNDAIEAIYNYENQNNAITSDKLYVLLGIYGKNAKTTNNVDNLLSFDPTKIITLKIKVVTEEINDGFELTSNPTSAAATTTIYMATTTTAAGVDAAENSGTQTTSSDSYNDTGSNFVLDENQVTSYAEEYGITITKMNVIMTIIQTSNDYNDVADIQVLADMDLQILFQLYEQSTGQ